MLQLLLLAGLGSAAEYTVHLIPHSHDDVGWRKTVDQYFYGTNKGTQWTNVQVELTTVINALLENPDRKFSEVEMKFFSQWWDEQDEVMKDKVRDLVNSGQLELLSGGWSMHDEACPIYEDMIDNMMKGHDFILKEFGVRPRVGWAIDPFGHSNTNARLFSEMGFDAWFFARMDDADKNNRVSNQEMEWIWYPSNETLGSDVNIFTHMLWASTYYSPGGFNFDVANNDGGLFIDDKLSFFNGDQKMLDFISNLDQRAAAYRSKDIFVVLGGDFWYMDAFWNFQQMDDLIAYFNENHGDKYELKYSTPSIYVDAVAAANITWPSKYDDLLPLFSDDSHAWTGFFSSRPNFKGYVRKLSGMHHASAQLFTEVFLDKTYSESIKHKVKDANSAALDAIGISMHHDAITGTSNEPVVADYFRIVAAAENTLKDAYNDMISLKAYKMAGLHSNHWQQCTLTNTSYMACPTKDMVNGRYMAVTVHNPSNVELSEIELPVAPGTYSVKAYDEDKEKMVTVESAIQCFADYIWTETTTNFTSCYLTVKSNAPSMGFAFLKVKKVSDQFTEETELKKQHIQRGGLQLKYAGNEGSQLNFELSEIKNSRTVHKFDFSLREWMPSSSFDSFTDSTSEYKTGSGPYVFWPLPDQYESSEYTSLIGAPTISVDESGASTMHFTFGEPFESRFFNSGPSDETLFKKASVHVSIDADLPVVKFVVDLGGLPKPNYSDGNEIIANFHVKDFKNDGEFYTDSNGLEMQHRKLNERASFEVPDYYLKYNVTANYYPVNSAITMVDKKDGRRFTVMNDRSQGGSALKDGNIELMQNRELPSDDHLGQDDRLIELDEFGNQVRVKATYFVEIIKANEESAQKLVQQKTLAPAQVFYSSNFIENDRDERESPSAFGKQLQDIGVKDKVRISFVPKSGWSADVRLQNLEDPLIGNSGTATVDLNGLADIMWPGAGSHVSITELTLTGNQPLEHMMANKIKWNSTDSANLEKKLSFDTENVKLEPQRIRVFNLAFSGGASAFLQ